MGYLLDPDEDFSPLEVREQMAGVAAKSMSACHTVGGGVWRPHSAEEKATTKEERVASKTAVFRHPSRISLK